MNRIKEAEAILGNLVVATHMLQSSSDFAALIPEVRVNLVCALPGAQVPGEVAGVEGRITAVRGFPRAAGLPSWGVSDHMARRVIEARKYDAEVSAGINFRYNNTVVSILKEYAAEFGILFGGLDRTKEPPEAMGRDGASMPWKVKQLVEAYGRIPRLSYEGEGWGKEPLCFAMGKDAVEVAGIAIEIARRYKERA